VPTGSCFELDDGDLIGNTDVLRGYADLGIMPVMFGDVVLDRKRGFGICSGDRIVEFLASVFSPEMVVFVSDVDGLYDKDPKKNRDAILIGTVDHASLGTAATDISVADVTGGVRAKMETMLRMSSPGRDCVLVNGTVKGRLRSLLTGDDVTCTRAKGGIL
jgi:isopentenyl phosphate kinase